MASHALDKQARRAARLHAEAEAKQAKARRSLVRRAGYVAIATIAIALVAVAVLGRGSNQASMVAMGGGAPAVGLAAPSFDLTDVVTGRPVTNTSLLGHKTLLFFSEGVSCQACLVQAADLQKSSALAQAGIQLISITTDQPGALATAAKQYGITTPMLADPTTAMSEAYGMLSAGGMRMPGQDGHAFMLLSPNGRILWQQAYSSMYVPTSRLMSDMQRAA
jgi:peroxiredoxin